MAKLDLEAIADREIKTNVYLYLIAVSEPMKDGRLIVDSQAIRFRKTISDYIADTKDSMTVRFSLDHLFDREYIEWDMDIRAHVMRQDFQSRFINLTREEADLLCKTNSNRYNQLLLYLKDKCRYFKDKGGYKTTFRDLVEDAWNMSPCPNSNSKMHKMMDQMASDGKIQYKVVREFGTRRVIITAAHL